MPSRAPKLWWPFFLVAVVIADQILKSELGSLNANNWLSFGNHVYWLLAGSILVGVIVWPRSTARNSFLTLVAGVFSNSLDVLLTGGVRDYLPWFGFNTNIADVLIIVGAIGVLRVLRPLP